MKTLILSIFFAILLLPIQIFSQIDNKYELNSHRLLQERINSITKPDAQIKQRLQSANFSNSQTRTIINKKILDNGFLLIEEIQQNWDDSIWVNSWKWTYTYDINSYLIEQLGQLWDGSNWMDVAKGTYTYDLNNNKIEELWQDWDGSNWVNMGKGTYTYDVNNNMIKAIWQNWDGSNWVNSGRTLYSYIPTDVNEFKGEVNTYSLSNNYPNPFNPTTKIKSQIPELSLVVLKVYDVLGNEIATLVNEEKPIGSYTVEFDASTLPSGVYFYQLKAGDFIQTKKMILMK